MYIEIVENTRPYGLVSRVLLLFEFVFSVLGVFMRKRRRSLSPFQQSLLHKFEAFESIYAFLNKHHVLTTVSNVTETISSALKSKFDKEDLLETKLSDEEKLRLSFSH